MIISKQQNKKMQKQGYLYAVIGESYIVTNKQSLKKTCAIKSEHQYLIGRYLEIEGCVAIVLSNESFSLATNFGEVANIRPSTGDIFSDVDGNTFTVIGVQEDGIEPFVTIEY